MCRGANDEKEEVFVNTPPELIADLLPKKSQLLILFLKDFKKFEKLYYFSASREIKYYFPAQSFARIIFHIKRAYSDQ